MTASRHALRITLMLTLLAAPLVAEAQQATTVRRMGYLTSTSYLHPDFFLNLGNALRDHGYVVGRNLLVESRHAAGHDDRLADLAAELVRARVEVIVADGIPAALAAKQTTQSIPIVMAIGGDPVASKLVSSFARPGGNITGVTSLALDLVAKRLQLLTEVVPKLTRVAVIWNPLGPEKQLEWKELATVAPKLSVTLESLEIRSSQDIEPVLSSVIVKRAGGLLVLDDSLTLAHSDLIVDTAQKHRLPAIYAWRLFVDRRYAQVGGLMSYGPSLFDIASTVAAQVGKILKGEKPADLPIEQPTKFELVVNLNTAKALGLTIPQSVLLRADVIIQ